MHRLRSVNAKQPHYGCCHAHKRNGPNQPAEDPCTPKTAACGLNASGIHPATLVLMLDVRYWAKADGRLLQSERSRPGSPRRTRSRKWLHLDTLCQRQGILDVDAEVAHGVLDLGVAEKDLNRTQVA